MRLFIGNPNACEYYYEDEIDSDLFYDGTENVFFLDASAMGIEIVDEDEEVDDIEDDEDFESFSLGGLGDSTEDEDEDEEYIDNDEDSLSDEGKF